MKERGLVIGLDGPLGVGKTIFTKGVAEFLGITETVVSPTYTYREEYDFERHGVRGQLFHLDLWKVDSVAQAERLEIEQLLIPHTVTVIEWWSQVDEYLHQLVKERGAALMTIKIDELSGHRRQLQVWEQS